MEVRSIVSDRASALVKLGQEAYLGVCSMPDLFHYMQDIGKAVGCQLGKQLERAHKAVHKAEDSSKQQAQEYLASLQQVYASYREQTERINQLVHPFNEQNDWNCVATIEKGLFNCLTSINKIAGQVGIEISLKKAQKIYNQINPIAQGVQSWIVFTKQDLEQLQQQQRINSAEKQWLITYAIPCVYWQIQLNRTQTKARNANLRAYYKKRQAQAQQKWRDSELIKQLSEQRLERLMAIAYQIASSFQRASSQTEGRNGYLAFVNHAHRGMAKKRLQVLTVIHNYDIKRIDGTTPAQRLFGREFPDLFEFLCQHVTGFKEPKKRNRNSLKFNILQR